MPTRLAATLAALAAALLVGCGGSSSPGEGSTQGGATSPPAGTSSAPLGATAKSCEAHSVDAGSLRATGISCGQARQVMYGWQHERSCSTPAGASRTACLSRSYRCLSTRTARGLTVSCSRPGQSIAFTVQRP